MPEALVRVDNTMVWDGQRQPFYEVYYMKLHAPGGEWSLWLRYTLCTPYGEHSRGVSSLWAIFTDRENGIIALKEDFNLESHDVVHSDNFIQIGDSYLSLAEACGVLESVKAQIKWNFIFEDPVCSLRPYPWYLYQSRLPRTKFLIPRLVNYVSGTFYINDTKIDLRRVPVHQAHLYGTAYASNWAWANCISFKEDPDVFFDGLTAQIPLRGKLSPPLSVFSAGFGGKIYQARGPLQILMSNQSKWDFDAWELAFKKCGKLFEVVIRRDPRLVAGVTYLGPNGEHRYCYNSGLSAIEMSVSEKLRGSWQRKHLFTSAHACSYETVYSEPQGVCDLVL